MLIPTSINSLKVFAWILKCYAKKRNDIILHVSIVIFLYVFLHLFCISIRFCICCVFTSLTFFHLCIISPNHFFPPNNVPIPFNAPPANTEVIPALVISLFPVSSPNPVAAAPPANTVPPTT